MLEGLLYMEKASDGLGNSRELADLLYYLSNAIMHYRSAFERLNGRLVSPCLTDPDHWHMSWQCGWLRARQDVLNEMDEGMGHCGWFSSSGGLPESTGWSAGRVRAKPFNSKFGIKSLFL